MDLLRWAITEHPKAVLTLLAAWFGLGWLGRSWQASKKIAKGWPLVVIPAAVLWLLARKYKGGRRGIALAAPWVFAIVWVGAFLLVPRWRTLMAGPPLLLSLAYGVWAFDAWIDHRTWTWGNVQRAWARDEATLAFRSGVLVAMNGEHAKIGRATVAEDGRMAVEVTVPSGHSVGALGSAADDGRFGAAANTYGLGLADVEVRPHQNQGKATVTGTVVGASNPFDDPAPHPGLEL